MLNSNLEQEIKDAIAAQQQQLPKPPADSKTVTIYDFARLLSENEIKK